MSTGKLERINLGIIIILKICCSLNAITLLHPSKYFAAFGSICDKTKNIIKPKMAIKKIKNNTNITN